MYKKLILVFFISLSGFSQQIKVNQKFSNYLSIIKVLPLSECSFINGKYSHEPFSQVIDVEINCSNKSNSCLIQFPNGRRVLSTHEIDANGVDLNLFCVKDNSIYTKLLFVENSQFNTYIQSFHVETALGRVDKMLVLQDFQQQKSFIYFQNAK